MKTAILLSIASFLICTAASVSGDRNFLPEGSRRSIILPAPAVPLKDGYGREITVSFCSICHSLDYITTQQKFPKSKWRAEVAKMIKTYGAPISEENADIIADYIAAHYGTGR